MQAPDPVQQIVLDADVVVTSRQLDPPLQLTKHDAVALQSMLPAQELFVGQSNRHVVPAHVMSC